MQNLLNKINLLNVIKITKSKTHKCFKKLEIDLKKTIGINKKFIVSQIRFDTPPKGESEGRFIKDFLSERLQNVFKNKIVIEGVNSKGRTQFKLPFFKAKPAPDFIIEEPFCVIGEVKYCKLSTRKVGTAIGQILLYLVSSKEESTKYDYGCVIFFDTSIKLNKLQEKEVSFIEHLWKNENIFLIII